MNHNPFVTKNNDLFIMVIAGALTLVITRYCLDLTVQAQFLMILTFGFLAGLFMNYLYQCLEWALFFSIGIQLVALAPLVRPTLLGSTGFSEIIGEMLRAGHYSLFLLSSWLIAIPAGFMLQKLIMGGGYYRKTHF